MDQLSETIFYGVLIAGQQNRLLCLMKKRWHFTAVVEKFIVLNEYVKKFKFVDIEINKKAL